jgi:hypothetical protein
MREQILDFPKLENRNDNFSLDCIHNKADTESALDAQEQDSLRMIASSVEFFRSFVYCQTLLCKSWLEASDKLTKKVQIEKENLDISSAYVDVHEEIFTTLFKSPEYASNLGRMINASMVMMKNWKILAQNSSDSIDNDWINKNEQ